jgi:pseudaminic acid synthase
MNDLRIDGRTIGQAAPPFVIAEISANHLGDRGLALEIVSAAASAGADAIKLQHYTPDTITVRSQHSDFSIEGGTLWDGRQLYDLYAEAMMPWEWTESIVALAKSLGMTWLSTPFDSTAVTFLQDLDVPAFKIASFELIDLPLIREVAGHGKPMIMSTGMATLEEIDAAVEAARVSGATEIVLLRCNSGYPAVPSEMSLSAIPEMRSRWGTQVGISDHTLGSTSAIVAVSLGATVIEKHLTIRRADGGPDASFSLEPDEFADLVTVVRDAHAALGTPRFGPSSREVSSRKFRPSLRAVRPIAAGELLTPNNVASIRPSGGLDPDCERFVFGSIATSAMGPGDPVTTQSFVTAE